MYQPKTPGYSFSVKEIKLTDKWNFLRKLGQDQLSLPGQLKLEWIIFYQTIGKRNAKLTALHFGISRKTLHKWLKRFDDKHLKSLEESSRAPNKTRDWMVSLIEEERIISLRKKNLEFGKKKLRRIYLREYGKNISTWKIERVIRKHQLYPDPKRHDQIIKKRHKSELKIRIHQVKDQIKQIKEFGALWHIDAIIIWWSKN